jgi:Protein of unknown function (DUF1757)
MSRYFPHPPYAEDQPFSRTILTTHVLHRGFQLGALLGCAGGLSYSAYRYLRPPTSATPAPQWGFRNLILPTTLRTTGIGATAGLGLMALGVTGRMWGREEIEWQDRAWRLLENEGQMSTDDWSLDGMVVGATLALLAARRGVIVIKNRPLAVVGAAGLGSLIGTEGSMEWRALRTTST